MSSVEKHIAVICYDHRNMIAGRLLNAGSEGCEVLTGTDGLFPLFSSGADVVLNLYDEVTELQEIASARLQHASREHSGWVYRLSWFEVPTIIKTKEVP